ncbi:MAG: aminotransferase class I/II-fold pyridoxal phosphate-dependent enzyme [Clostridia bacterium]|nr:aminotransferase class I/II-fold pyridoxal phosphate-dependent enzyme [Clostridia bacterium]
MILSNNLENVHSDIRGDIYMHALELEKAGRKVLKLNTGNPAAFGFKMPESIKNRIITDVDKALGYCDIRGMEAAWVAIKEYHLSRGIKNISENDIFIGNGVSEVAYMIISALIGKDDEVLVPTPCYSLWTNFTFLVGGKARFYKCDESAKWEPDIESIKRGITSNTKAIVLINPNNPTGALYSKETLLAIIDIARKNNLVIISDEIYDRLVLDGKQHIPTASLCDDVTIVTMNGLSKSHCICGLRCGWMCVSGNEKRKKILCEGLVKIASVRLCSNALMQLVIPDALKDCAYTENMINQDGRLLKQRNAVMEELDKIDGISYVKNTAAFYLFPKLDIKKFGFEDDREFARKLLDEKNILIIPGSGFNCVDKKHFRIVMLPEEDILRNSIKDIGDFLNNRRQS